MKKSILCSLFFIVTLHIDGSIILNRSDIAVTMDDKLVVGQWSMVDAVYTIPEGYYIAADSPFLKLTIEPHDLMVMGSVSIKSKAINDKYSGTVKFTQRIKPLKPLENQIIGMKAEYQLCNDEGICYLPQSVILSRHITVEDYPALDAKKILIYLALAFMGGMLLNIMPCVLPVLSLKFLMISKLPPEESKKFATQYTLGIVVAFILLALFIVTLKLLGHAIGFGFHWQNYSFIVFMLMVVVLMALNLLDMFPFVMSSRSPHSAFGHGLVTVLLSTPCSAPFLGVAAGWALSQNSAVIFIFFIIVALGLAAPLAILISIPQSYGLLKTFSTIAPLLKWVAAISLVLVARWLLSLIISQANLAFLLIALLIFSLAVFIWSRFIGTKYQKMALVTTALLLILSFVVAVNTRQVGKPIAIKAPWQPYSIEMLDEAIANQQPVFINVSANWCLTCRFNEATVLSNKDLLSFFKDHHVLLLKADLSYGVSKEQQKLLNEAGRQSLPTYVIYGVDGELQVLSELLTTTKIKKLLLAQ